MPAPVNPQFCYSASMPRVTLQCCGMVPLNKKCILFSLYITTLYIYTLYIKRGTNCPFLYNFSTPHHASQQVHSFCVLTPPPPLCPRPSRHRHPRHQHGHGHCNCPCHNHRV